MRKHVTSQRICWPNQISLWRIGNGWSITKGEFQELDFKPASYEFVLVIESFLAAMKRGNCMKCWEVFRRIFLTEEFTDFNLSHFSPTWKWGKTWETWCSGADFTHKILINSLKLPVSVLDADHNGYLDFKEFQQAIDLVGARLPDDRLRWSFRLYDMDNSGSIALNEMEGVFDCIYNMFEVRSALHNGNL